MSSPIDDAAKYELDNVHKVYSEIAEHFSATRYKPWPYVSQYLSSLPAASLVADVGCGNGKYMGINPNLLFSGSDRCAEFAKICVDRGFECITCDNMVLPYRTASFDATISIAVIHHFSTPERRASAIRELLRILRPGGSALIYVWALEQTKTSRRHYDEQDVLVPWNLTQKFVQKKPDAIPSVCGGGEGKKKKKEGKNSKKTQSQQPADESIQHEQSQSPQSLPPSATASSSSSEPPISAPLASSVEESIPAPSSAGSSEGQQQSEERGKSGEVVYKRYYHFFKQGELEELVMGLPEAVAGELAIEASGYEADNWHCVVRKLK